MVKVISKILGYLKGRIKELKEAIRQIFKYDNNDKKLGWISREMQKNYTIGGQIPDKKSVILTVDMNCFNLTNKL